MTNETETTTKVSGGKKLREEKKEITTRAKQRLFARIDSKTIIRNVLKTMCSGAQSANGSIISEFLMSIGMQTHSSLAARALL